MHVVVATVVHHPQDARIAHRQVEALLAAGHRVTYLAPFRDSDVQPDPRVRGVDVPRVRGRHRLGPVRAARKQLRTLVADADLLLVHDPDLLLALPWKRPPTVWDVHEDTAAALSMRSWVPAILVRPGRWAVRALERLAESRLHLILAEEGYRDRFRRPHPVVPNTTPLPPPPPEPGTDRVVYLGHLSHSRGALDMLELAQLLPDGVTVDIIGSADAPLVPELQEAVATGRVRWHGFVPNADAVRLLPGALAGLSLLHDQANYRHSRPTKIIEYMAAGVPVVSTPNPSSAELVESAEAGLLVPFDSPRAAADALLRLRDDAALRRRLGAQGRAAAAARYAWDGDAPRFVAVLEAWAGVRATSIC